MAKYIPDTHCSEGNRPRFAFASYNGGRATSQDAQESCKAGARSGQVVQQRRDRHRREDGIETTPYVRNVDKVYVVDGLTLDAQDAAEKARLKVAPVDGSKMRAKATGARSRDRSAVRQEVFAADAYIAIRKPVA